METQHLKISELFSFFIDLSSYSSSCQRRRRRLDGVLRGEGGVWSSVSPRRIINLIWCLDLRGCDSLQMWLIEKPDYVSALCHSADLWPLQAAAGFQSVKILLMSSALPGLLMTVNGFYTVRSAMRRCSDNQTQCKTQNLPTQPQQRTTAQKVRGHQDKENGPPHTPACFQLFNQILNQYRYTVCSHMYIMLS